MFTRLLRARIHRATVLILAGCLVALAVRSGSLPFASAAAPAASEERSGRDPLSRTELARVDAGLKNDAALSARLKASRRIEPLLVELHREDKADLLAGAAPRRADALFYDYDADLALRAIVDVRTGKVAAIEQVPGMKPPISAAEGARALAIALADPATAAMLREEYRALTGADLARPEQLTVTAGVFHADTTPALPAAAACAARRCAQLMLTTADGKGLSAMPIVNLSAERVLFTLN